MHQSPTPRPLIRLRINRNERSPSLNQPPLQARESTPATILRSRAKPQEPSRLRMAQQTQSTIRQRSRPLQHPPLFQIPPTVPLSPQLTKPPPHARMVHFRNARLHRPPPPHSPRPSPHPIPPKSMAETRQLLSRPLPEPHLSKNLRRPHRRHFLRL